jgi:hypothetical protein
MRPLVCLVYSLLIFCCTLSSSLAKAQTTEDSVKTAVNNLFTAYRNADSAALVKCFGPNAVLQTITNTGVRTITINDMASFVAQQQKNEADERITFETIKIDGPLAAVWAPYKFYHNKEFSHQGVDAFQLVRLPEGWRIQYIIDTRRK